MSLTYVLSVLMWWASVHLQLSIYLNRRTSARTGGSHRKETEQSVISP